MKGRVIGAVARSLERYALPKDAIYVSSGYKIFPYQNEKSGRTCVYTDNLQYCTAVLLRPKIIKPDLRFAFAHFEAYENKNMTIDEIDLMVRDLCKINDTSPDDLMAHTFSLYYSKDLTPAFSTLSDRSSQNVKTVSDTLSNSGVKDIYGRYISNIAIKTDGTSVSEIGISSRVSGAVIDKINNGSFFRDKGKN